MQITQISSQFLNIFHYVYEIELQYKIRQNRVRYEVKGGGMQRTVVKKSKWDFAESRRSHPCTLLEKPYEIRSIIESALYGDFFNRCCSRDQQALCILYLHIQKILMRRHAHIFFETT